MPTLNVIGVKFGAIGGNGGLAFDSDYQAVLNYAISLGYTLPSASQKIKQNALLVSLKAAGVWTKLDTFAIFANDGGSNFGLIDWKRLALYTAVNSPTFTTNQGFTGNGTSSYIDTNFNPATSGTNYVLNDASRYYMQFAGTGTTVFDGVMTGNLTNTIRAGATGQSFINGAALSSSFTYNNGQGVRSIHRTSSIDVFLYNDKTQATRNSLSSSVASQTQLILRRGTFYGSNQTYGYAMGASMNAENSAFVDALNFYIASL
jgi:hypothetical protein